MPEDREREVVPYSSPYLHPALLAEDIRGFVGE